MSASNTPRTDAVESKYDDEEYRAAVDCFFLARDLERELADSRATNRQARIDLQYALETATELLATADATIARLREALRGIVERPEVFGIHDEVPSGKRIIAVVSMANWEAARAALVQS
jgi:hypothetical protein